MKKFLLAVCFALIALPALANEGDGETVKINKSTGAFVNDNGSKVLSGNHVSSSKRYAVADVNFTIPTDAGVVALTSISTARTFTLPVSANMATSQVFTVIDESGSVGSHNLTLMTQGSDTINGAGSVVISTANQSVQVETNGTGKYFTIATSTGGGGTISIGANATSAGFTFSTGTLNLSAAPTGSGGLVLATSPTLVTPVLGVATATTINGLTITTGGSGTLTVGAAAKVQASSGSQIVLSHGVDLVDSGTGTITVPTGTGTLVLSTLAGDVTLNGHKFIVSAAGDSIAWLGSSTLLGTDSSSNPYLQSKDGVLLGFDATGDHLVFSSHNIVDSSGYVEAPLIAPASTPLAYLLGAGIVLGIDDNSNPYLQNSNSVIAGFDGSGNLAFNGNTYLDTVGDATVNDLVINGYANAFHSDGSGNGGNGVLRWDTGGNLFVPSVNINNGAMINADTSGYFGTFAWDSSGDITVSDAAVNGNLNINYGTSMINADASGYFGTFAWDSSGDITVSNAAVNGNLSVVGSFNSDATQINTDGSGDLVARNFTVSDGETTFCSMGLGGFSGDGSGLSGIFQPSGDVAYQGDNVSEFANDAGYVTGYPNQMNFDGSSITSDGSGDIFASSFTGTDGIIARLSDSTDNMSIDVENRQLIDNLASGGTEVAGYGYGDGSLRMISGLFYPLPVATGSAPTYANGGEYFNTTTNRLTVGGASAWESVSTSVPTPSTSTSAGTPGQFATDGTYLYVCTGASAWKRILLTTF